MKRTFDATAWNSRTMASGNYKVVKLMDPAPLSLSPRQAEITSQIKSTSAVSWLYRLIGRVIVLDVSRLMCGETRTIGQLMLDLPEFKIRELTDQDLLRHSNSTTCQIANDWQDRLDRGHCCFGAFHGSRLIGYCWFARNSIDAANNRGRHPQSGVGLKFSDDATFTYDGFTAKTYRGQNVIPAILILAAKSLHEDGILKMLATTDWTNAAALRAMEKCKFRSVGHIRKLSFMNASFTSLPKQAFEMGIHAL